MLSGAGGQLPRVSNWLVAIQRDVMESPKLIIQLVQFGQATRSA